jgi:predicted ATPase with chaperone activity
MSGPQLPAPRTLEEAGLSLELVTQLALKTLHHAGELTGAELAKRLGVLFSVVEPSLTFLKNLRHIEVVGGTIVGGSSYRYRITTEGRSTASVYLRDSQYVGAVPVPLSQYRAYMATLQGMNQRTVTRTEVRRAFAHLVLSDTVLDEIGPAINGGHSIFIYGAPGNGKTSIAQTIRDLLGGDVAIPHAIEVEGSIIRVLDPINHEMRPEPNDDGLAVDRFFDRRWAMCRRPVILAGGEMSLESLELNFDGRLGYYRAPLQLVANGGVLVVDDFGRQRSAPRDLLNRWMVPLESGVDYLTLASGMKFDLPFELFIAFATNIKPSDLVDEAFLRRVQYKVFAESPSRESFITIFERYCRERGIPFERSLATDLLDGYYRKHHIEMRACQPRDLINQALLLAEYRGQKPVLTPELLQTACEGYFVKDE